MSRYGLLPAYEGVDYFCDGLTVMETLNAKGEDLYQAVMARFNQGMEAGGFIIPAPTLKCKTRRGVSASFCYSARP